MAEISDAQLAELKQAHALLAALYADGNVSVDFKKIVKKKFPNANIPDLDAMNVAEKAGTDIAKKVEESTAALAKKVDDFLKDRAKEREESDVARFEASIKKVVKDRGYTEDGEKKLLELMKERNIHDPEDAALIFESRQPKEAPKPRAYSTRMNFVTADNKDDEKFKQLMTDPEQYMMDEMTAALEGVGEE